MKIYLAGKIAKHCWRSSLVKEKNEHGFSYDRLRGVSGLDCDDIHLQWPILKNCLIGDHDYVGPYFVGDDHGCGHAPNSHGASLRSPCCDGNYKLSGHQHRHRIVENCLSAIDRADLVFAWIEDLTAYGTLFELGYAKAKGIRVAVAFHSKFASKVASEICQDGRFEMWFPEMAVENTCFAGSAIQGYLRLVPPSKDAR